MALSANTKLKRRNSHVATTSSYGVKTSSVIYQDALVGITATGLLVPLSNSTTIRFVGIAYEAELGATFPVTGSATVTTSVKVQSDLEVLVPMTTAVTVGLSLNTNIFGVDDQTATSATTLGPVIGTLEKFVAANSGWVRLRGVKGTAAS
jgi:hypothetical protein